MFKFLNPTSTCQPTCRNKKVGFPKDLAFLDLQLTLYFPRTKGCDSQFLLNQQFEDQILFLLGKEHNILDILMGMFLFLYQRKERGRKSFFFFLELFLFPFVAVDSVSYLSRSCKASPFHSLHRQWFFPNGKWFFPNGDFDPCEFPCLRFSWHESSCQDPLFLSLHL